MTEKKIVRAATLATFPLEHMNRVYDIHGVAPTIASRSGGWTEPKIYVPPGINIKANQRRGYMRANVGDFVWLSFTDGRHTPVIRGVSGTVTAHVGEMGVVVAEDDKMDIENATIRKLTEREALYLQGFKEEADMIVDAKDGKGKRVFPMTTCYVFAGNAVCVNAF